MAGKSGYTIETINGVKMFASYAPIRAITTTWAVLSSLNKLAMELMNKDRELQNNEELLTVERAKDEFMSYDILLQCF
jgi:hypothetical protein